MKRCKGWRMRQSHILQIFRRFTYVTAHSPTLPLLHLRHRHFTYVTWRAAHVLLNVEIAILIVTILQPFRRFTYVTAHSQTIPSIHLRHSSFYNPSFASPTSQALHLRRRYFTYATWRAAHVLLNVEISILIVTILQSFRRFTYVTASLQAFRRFTYVIAHSTTLPLLHLRHLANRPCFVQCRNCHINCYNSPILSSLHLRHSSFYNPSVASPT